MSASKARDEEFIEVWHRYKEPRLVAKALDVPVRNVHARRRRIEVRHGIVLPSANANFNASPHSQERKAIQQVAERRAREYEREMGVVVQNGVVLVASDCHYWPGIVTTAHQALCTLAKELKPAMLVLNGDILDGARISRHPRIGWEKQPTLKDEVHALQDRCAELERAAGGAQLIRTIGNHDARFENYMSANAPELEDCLLYTSDAADE